MAVSKYPPSESGSWTVKLEAVYIDETGFAYKPAHDITVHEEDLLKDMIAKKKVANVVAAA
jgi:hypothetical protein